MVPGGAVEIASLNTARAIIIQAFTGIADLLYLFISIFIINLYQILIICSSILM